jgi:hypothetical protein
MSTCGGATLTGETYRQWLQEVGLDVIDERFVPEGDGGHELFLARLPI